MTDPVSLADETIVCFAPEPWDGLWRNRHQLMTRLAQHNRVLWVEPRPYLSHVQRALHSHRAAPFALSLSRPQHVRDQLYVLRTPLWLPLSGRTPLREATAWGRRLLLQRALRQMDTRGDFPARTPRAPIVWLFRPNQADVMGQLGEQLLIYHAVDEYAAYELEFQDDKAANRPAAVHAVEETILRRADLVLVTSAPLLESKRPYNANTHLVPNGVDYAAFAAAVREPVEPAVLAGIPHPRLGFVGAVNEKVDLHLLAQLAQAYPDWSIVLVGPLTLRYHLEDLETLRSLPNVHICGAVPVAQVPHAIQACDVGLMPYKINAWTHNISPLKLYEYLAIGHPVVSTAIPAVVGLETLVTVAATPAAFVTQVGQTLSLADDADARTRRRAFAAQQTWDARVADIMQLIVKTLQDKRDPC